MRATRQSGRDYKILEGVDSRSFKKQFTELFFEIQCGNDNSLITPAHPSSLRYAETSVFVTRIDCHVAALLAMTCAA